MYITTFQYRAEHLNCKLCTQFKSRRCAASRCPWLAEHAETCTAKYQEAIREVLPRSHHLHSRTHNTVWRFSGSLFLTAAHRQRMRTLQKHMGHHRSRDTPAYFAAMYLLSANGELYHRAANCFCEDGIDFGLAAIRGITPHDYTLFSAARDIYEENTGVTLADLSNGAVVDTLAFSLIVNALLIVRYGSAVLDLRERGNIA